MKLRLLILSIAILLCGSVNAQKKAIDKEAYALWKRVDNYALSPDGRFVTYKYAYIDNDEKNNEIENQYFLFDYKTKKTIVIDNASSLNFSPKGDWLRYNQGETLYFKRLKDGKVINWKHKENPSFEDIEGYVSYDINNDFVLYNLNKGDSIILKGAKRVKFYDNGSKVIYIKDSDKSTNLIYGELNKPSTHKILFSDNTKSLNGYFFNKSKLSGDFQVASKKENNRDRNLVYKFDIKKGVTEKVLDVNEITLEEPLYIDKYTFNKEVDRKYVTFEVFPSKPAPRQKKEKGDKDESFELELWSWDDPVSQSVQEISGYRPDIEKGDIYAFNTETKKSYKVVSTPYSSINTSSNPRCDFIYITDETPYAAFSDWQHDKRADIYLVDLRNGEKKLIDKANTHRPEWSKNGTHVIYYNSEQKSWFSLEPYSFKHIKISKDINVSNETYDRPNPRPSYGTSGWSSDGKILYINDKYDIWAVDITGEKNPYCITKGYGRKNNAVIRFINPDFNTLSINYTKNIDVEICYLNDMSTSIGTLSPDGNITKHIEGDYLYLILKNSNNNQVYLYHKQNLTSDRDLWISDSKFKKPYRITVANPQQKEYLQGSVEIVEWTMFDNKKNRGLLYLPEGYEKGKSYPTIVNFYEDHVGEKNIYHAPAYSSAMLDLPTYLSKGYIVFMPDVYFTIGEPGKSSYNSVVSGTQSLIDKGIIDPNRVGLQGHSWSGYQTSYLVTKTDMFKCVNIGAPIVNMTSAYNGIREGSGLPRMFMYEDWQCRMGTTMWKALDKFIESSPILFADKINTPVLLFHCDKDEAVSFYEGRSLFLALRRLQRPAWMLNYKGEGHFVTSKGAKRDWTIRMEQFFDYYLKGTSMPRWMDEGINIKERGYDQKLDFIK